MTPVSLIVPYYNESDRLEEFLSRTEALEFFDEIIFVDDGSQTHPAEPVIREYLQDYPEGKISLYRIPVDYGFNAHGARNLAATKAKNEWMCFLDIDMCPDVDWCKAFFRMVERCDVDHFVLISMLGDDPGNIFACRKTHYFAAGGYDEELRGWHMGDKLFRFRLDRLALPRLMNEKIVCNRLGRTVKTDDSITGTHYPDDRTVVQRHPKHINAALRMINDRNEKPETWTDIPILQFDWERIL